VHSLRIIANFFFFFFSFLSFSSSANLNAQLTNWLLPRSRRISGEEEFGFFRHRYLVSAV
jgi:hypothetical protein